MIFYSNHGKYMAPRRPGSRLVRGLLAVFLLLLTLVAGMLLLLVRNRQGEGEAQPLSQETQQIQAAPVQTETALPTVESVAAETEGYTAPPQTQPIQTQPEEKVILSQYAELYDRNSDLFGWIRIEGTKIDYPVMHTPDEPERYLHADFEKKYSYGGTPFLDAKCSPDSDNLLIYGHNMIDGSMFRSLMKYQEKQYWQQHPTILFDTLYEQQEFEVLAAFYDRVYFKTETVFKFYQFIDAADEDGYNDAVAQFKEKSLYDTGVEAVYGDQLITLVTCAYHTDNGRFVVVAKRK